jgi:hypothetical protein
MGTEVGHFGIRLLIKSTLGYIQSPVDSIPVTLDSGIRDFSVKVTIT